MCDFSVSFIMPKKELVKQRKKQDDIYLEYPLGESEILPDYRSNSVEIKKITDLIKEIRDDENAEIIEIYLQNYTAPSGSYILNQETSTKRAYNLKKYLQFLYGFHDNIFKVRGMADDWVRLEQLLIESDLEKKEDVLSVIWNTGIFEGREKVLRALRNGVPFRYMEEQLFPRLRRFSCMVTYTIRPFEVEKGKQILKTNPEQLSLDELYRIARTYKSYTPKFNKMINLALNLYPNSKTANLNAAAVALKYKNILQAETLLQCANKHTPEYLNNKGVLYVIKGDYNKAWHAFKYAVQEGSNDGEFNLMMMEKIKIYT